MSSNEFRQFTSHETEGSKNSVQFNSPFPSSPTGVVWTWVLTDFASTIYVCVTTGEPWCQDIPNIIERLKAKSDHYSFWREILSLLLRNASQASPGKVWQHLYLYCTGMSLRRRHSPSLIPKNVVSLRKLLMPRGEEMCKVNGKLSPNHYTFS